MISWDGKRPHLQIGDRGLRARSIVSAANGGPEAGWTAVLELSSGCDMTITANEQSVSRAMAKLWARPYLWTQPDEDGTGVAVVVDRDEVPSHLAAIPLCDCGEQGCANAGRQLEAWLVSDELLELIQLLDGLSLGRGLSDSDRTWDRPHQVWDRADCWIGPLSASPVQVAPLDTGPATRSPPL